MPKQSVIKWRESDRAELGRIRKNFNAKITRLEKAGIAKEFLPEKISVKNIYKDVATRRDLNKVIKQAEIFTSRGSEKIVEYKGQQLPKFEKERISTMIRSVQQSKAIKRKELTPEKGNTTLAKETDLRALNIDRKRTPDEWKKFVYSLEKQFTDKGKIENAIKYKQNYLKAIREVLGEHGKELAEFIEKQDPMSIADGYTYDDLTSIRFTYDKINPSTVANAALSKWKEYIKSK